MQAALVAAGIVRRLITAYAGESYPAGGVNPVFQQRDRFSGDVEIENWSQWTFVQRLMAGALGLPFLPTRSLAGSGLAEQQPRARAMPRSTIPSAAGSIGVVAPLVPDLAILQGLAADAFGNVVMSPPYGESHWGALAARDGVIACVERIVPTDAIRAAGHAGAHTRPCRARPSAWCRSARIPMAPSRRPRLDVPSYVEDDAFIAEVARACRTPGRCEPGSTSGSSGSAGSRRLSRQARRIRVSPA